MFQSDKAYNYNMLRTFCYPKLAHQGTLSQSTLQIIAKLLTMISIIYRSSQLANMTYFLPNEH